MAHSWLAETLLANHIGKPMPTFPLQPQWGWTHSCYGISLLKLLVSPSTLSMLLMTVIAEAALVYTVNYQRVRHMGLVAALEFAFNDFRFPAFPWPLLRLTSSLFPWPYDHGQML